MITIEKIQERLATTNRPTEPITLSTSLVSGATLRHVIEAVIAEVNLELKKMGAK